MDRNHIWETRRSRRTELRRWAPWALALGISPVAVAAIVLAPHSARENVPRSDLLWTWLVWIALASAVLLLFRPWSSGSHLLPMNLIAVVARPTVLPSVLHHRTPHHSGLEVEAYHPAPHRRPARRASELAADVGQPDSLHRYGVIKRTFDLLMVAAWSVVVLPLVPIIALIIKLDSPGPVLYSQLRVGLHGHVFRIYKFRSMRTDAERDGAVWAQEADPRVTRVGRFLRRARIDELPQLWNVLRGEMAFVGPRPERPEFTSMLAAQLPTYGSRHSVKPGLTGWAQIKYRYASSVQDSATKLEYDLYYVGNRSLGFDAKILILTISVMLHLRGR